MSCQKLHFARAWRHVIGNSLRARAWHSNCSIRCMLESSRGDFRALADELDASSSQPTAELLAEAISRLKIASTSHAAGGPLGHSFAVSALGHTGPFRLLCEIASGGMATMHLAINRGIVGFELHQPRFPHIAARLIATRLS